MPPFDQYPTDPLIKALYLGDRAAGKTGSTVALAAAGFNVRILDLDAMAGVVKDFVTNPASIYLKPLAGKWDAERCKGLAQRISYVTITESMHRVQNKSVPKADAWQKIMTQLHDWRDGDAQFGNLESWTERDVLVIDGLTKLSKAAWNFQLAMNGRLLTRPEQNDYWQAQQLIENVLLELANPIQTRCHVIIIGHVDYIENDSGMTRGYPQTIGRALSPTVSGNFLHVIMAKSTGQGQQITRKIHTNTVGVVELRSSAPLKVKPEYPLDTGLADYFADVRGKYGP